jgi:hypothetical protein
MTVVATARDEPDVERARRREGRAQPAGRMSSRPRALPVEE